MSAMAPPGVPPEIEIFEGQSKDFDWIHFAFVNEQGEPVRGLPHSVQKPDEKVEGDLMGSGQVLFGGGPKGQYTAKLELDKLKK